MTLRPRANGPLLESDGRPPFGGARFRFQLGERERRTKSQPGAAFPLARPGAGNVTRKFFPQSLGTFGLRSGPKRRGKGSSLFRKP
jgi:hypothetical protein